MQFFYTLHCTGHKWPEKGPKERPLKYIRVMECMCSKEVICRKPTVRVTESCQANMTAGMQMTTKRSGT